MFVKHCPEVLTFFLVNSRSTYKEMVIFYIREKLGSKKSDTKNELDSLMNYIITYTLLVCDFEQIFC